MLIIRPPANTDTVYTVGTKQSVTGTAVKTTLGALLIPAGMMGPNSVLEIEAAFSVTGSTNSKITAISIGPNAASVVDVFSRGNTSASTLGQSPKVTLCARGATNSQVMPYSGLGTYGTNITVAPSTSSIDFTVDQTVWFFGTLTVTTETISFESAMITIRNPRR